MTPRTPLPSGTPFTHSWSGGSSDNPWCAWGNRLMSPGQLAEAGPAAKDARACPTRRKPAFDHMAPGPGRAAPRAAARSHPDCPVEAPGLTLSYRPCGGSRGAYPEGAMLGFARSRRLTASIVLLLSLGTL